MVTTADFVGRRVVVEVPATIANLGAGYDCVGLAIDLSLRVELSVEHLPGNTATDLEIVGEGAGEIGPDRGNRFVEALETGLRGHGIGYNPGDAWRIRMTNEIPLARGLGSSGAATMAGLLAADALAGGDRASPVTMADAERGALLAAATAIEGHPDNIAPALLGGFVAAAAATDGVTAFRFDAPDELRVVLFIPERRLPTAAMRRVLPATVPRADAVANLARVAIGVAGIAQGDWSVLGELTQDRLHEPYRAAAYPQLPVLVAAARAAGAIGACLAGAGSTIAAFSLASDAVAERIGAALTGVAAVHDLPGAVQIVHARNDGARVIER
jgi:homoserine kinase